uniref:Uncharacterized protein n=1 Tax=Tetranychus urticae TaxID=32264 RepID=T1K7Q3_TETUR
MEEPEQDSINYSDFSEVIDNVDQLESSEIKSKPSKWKPVWPGLRCIDCFGCCYFVYILFNCGHDKNEVHSTPVVSQPTDNHSIVSSSSTFSYDRPRRPTQMNIPLQMMDKKASITSTTLDVDNAEE